MTTRLDTELVRRGLARSRRHAGELIAAGRVTVDGSAVARSAAQVTDERQVAVQADDADPGYASRAGHKLAGALDALGADGPVVAGRHCLDAGASTGGFTDVLLRRGAARVVAVDVGHDQLVDALRARPAGRRPGGRQRPDADARGRHTRHRTWSSPTSRSSR